MGAPSSSRGYTAGMSKEQAVRTGFTLIEAAVAVAAVGTLAVLLAAALARDSQLSPFSTSIGLSGLSGNPRR